MSDVVIEVIENDVINVEVQEPDAFEVVEVGQAGPTGPAGSQILTGSSTPSNSLGVDGDIYFRDSGEVYKKILGVWSLEANVTGPQGIQGIQGIQGVQGDIGPQGIQGIQGATTYVGNIDGGAPDSVYGGIFNIDGGTP